MSGESAFGRRIGDFHLGDANSLFALAETDLCRRAREGAVADFSGRQTNRTVRACFVRFLLLGGDDDTPVHESGVRIKGALIRGKLDLDQCETKAALDAVDCEFQGGIVITDAKLENFSLEGCTVASFEEPALSGQAAVWGTRAVAKGSIFFRRETTLEGALLMQGAHIAGNLDLSGARISAVGATAVDLENAAIDGDLELRAFFPPGEPMPRADGDRDMQGHACWLQVHGKRLRSGGRLRLINLDNAHVGNRLRIVCARLEIEDESGATPPRQSDRDDNRALSGVGLKVDSGFEFHHVVKDAGVWLLGATLGILVDDLLSWGNRVGRNRFDGLTYGRIATESPHTFEDRRSWLLTQDRVDLKTLDGRGGFKSQPWTFTADALQKSGRAEDSRRLSMEAEWQRDRGDPGALTRLPRFLYWLFAGYGYSFRRLVLTAVAVCLFGYLAAVRGVLHNEFCVANPGVAFPGQSAPSACPSALPGQKKAHLELGDLFVWKVEFGEVFPSNDKKDDYPALYPLLYALENEIPGYSLDQKSFWRPAYGSVTNLLLSLQYTLGFLASAGIIAHFGSKLIRGPDKDG